MFLGCLFVTMLVLIAVSTEIFNDSTEEQRDLQRYRLRVQVLHERLLSLGCLQVSNVTLSNGETGERRQLDASEKVKKTARNGEGSVHLGAHLYYLHQQAPETR